MDDKLQELVALQKKQVELLEKYLWRVRFSLATLLLLTTGTCIGLGYMDYRMRGAAFPVAGPPPPVFAPLSIPPMSNPSTPILAPPVRRLPDGSLPIEPVKPVG
jgi:hypothetical protein